MFVILKWTRVKEITALFLILLLLFLAMPLKHEFAIIPAQDNHAYQTFSKKVTEKKEISLTFNVMWGDEVILDVLEELEQANLHASFFLNGKWMLRNEDLAELIIDRNHEIGLLGYDDQAYSTLTETEIVEDIKNGEELLDSIGYEPLLFVRPPEYEYNNSVATIIEQAGYHPTYWSLFAPIQASQDSEKALEHLNNHVSPGDVVLFPISDDLKETPNVLRDFIKSKKQDDFDFPTLSQLFYPADVELRQIQ
ncbi:polysaccharide deacetylase family protein [Halalkalibacillus halophilus]|uniref:polysaccharide deacetylase family protein n=1 Tax=Halalkalibacillus halophilus TaxID=392827 RepID=UPI00042A37FE|nr:polysaccharide deacetylase family protein [Halalkalibacillus halophilus]